MLRKINIISISYIYLLDLQIYLLRIGESAGVELRHQKVVDGRERNVGTDYSENVVTSVTTMPQLHDHVSEWVSEYRVLTPPSTHCMSFRRLVFPVNQWHWCWQQLPNQKNKPRDNTRKASNNQTQSGWPYSENHMKALKRKFGQESGQIMDER